jgi:uncharacterized protein (TIGR02147 family)
LEKPPISKFSNYRLYLREMFEHLRATKKSFSHRGFAKQAGIKSSNYIMLVIQGKRNLSPEMSESIAKALKLDENEFAYFVSMVCLESATSLSEKKDAEQKLLRSRSPLMTQSIEIAQKEVLADWWHLTIRELVTFPDFQELGDWIAQKLWGRISADCARDSLSLLLHSGYLRRKSDGHLEQSNPVIQTKAHTSTKEVLETHRKTWQNWHTWLPQIPEQQRELVLLNIALDAEKIPEFKGRIKQFCNEIIGWLHSEEKPTQIVQLGCYLMPVSKHENNT